jgi:hypothetical protein
MSRRTTPSRTQIQTGAGLIGLVLLLIGVLGFVPGITQNFTGLKIATDASTAHLFGIMQTSVLHNLLHLGTGVAGLICARTPLAARNYLLCAGVGYLEVFLYGIDVSGRPSLDLIAVDDPGNALHVAVATTMIACSVLLDCGPRWATVIQQGKAEI